MFRNIENDNPEKNKEVQPRNQILQTEPEKNNEKLKTPRENFADKYRVNPDELKKPENNDKPSESSDRPGSRGGEGRERGFDYER